MDADQYAKSINEHYRGSNLGANILAGLRRAGKDPDNITYVDLAPVDQFHTRGKDATLELAQMAGLKAGQRVTDVGGGLGGSARVLAAEHGCQVMVLDLTEEYCRVGEMLTARTGLADRVTFQVGSALDMPFEDGSFDVAWTQHSGMNIPDKERLYAEIARVLRPGGRLALHEIVAGEKQPIVFPVPWATTQEMSFLRPVEEMRSLIRDAGFREVAWVDVSRLTQEEWERNRMAEAAEPSGPPPIGLHLIFDERLDLEFKNLERNLDEGRIAIIEAVFDKV